MSPAMTPMLGRDLGPFEGPSSPGDHSVAERRCAGVSPSSLSRGRSNQRRTPMSLYAPPRSPTMKARKWSRSATVSGVERIPENVAPRTGLGDAEEASQSVPSPKMPCRVLHSCAGAGDWSRASLIFSRSVESRVVSEQGNCEVPQGSCGQYRLRPCPFRAPQLPTRPGR